MSSQLFIYFAANCMANKVIIIDALIKITNSIRVLFENEEEKQRKKYHLSDTRSLPD